MESKNEHIECIVELLLPPESLPYFEIERKESGERVGHIYLDELNIKPAGYEKEKLVSKGFHATATINDFPVRNKAMFLHVWRRRWKVESSGQAISRDWELLAKETRLTNYFATFLKGFLG